MKLFTSAIDKQLFAQYNMGNDLENQKVVAKIFNPYGRGTWYLLNSDPNDSDYIWAIVDLMDIEMGSVSRSELESIKVPPFRLPLERDTSFTPINALELYRGLMQGKRYANGGTTGFNADVEIVEDKIGKNYLFPKDSNPDTMGIEFAKGGNIKSFRKDEAYRLTPYNSIERKIMDRVPNEKEYKLAGNFYVKGHNNDAYIYFLDEFDRDYVKAVEIKPNERIYRYITRNSAIGGMMPLVKINLENGLVYYPIFKDEDVLVGFDSKGQKTEYLNLVEVDESDYYGKGGYMAEGGETEEGVDLFEDYDEIPPNVQKILDKNSDAFEFGDYRELEKLHKELQKIGYTFEYGLDGQPYDLRKIGQKGKSEDYASGGMMAKGGEVDNWVLYDNETDEIISFHKSAKAAKTAANEILDAPIPKHKKVGFMLESNWNKEKEAIKNAQELRKNNKMGMGGMSENLDILLEDAQSGKYYEKGGYMAKGGMVVTSIKDIPNFKQRLEERKITYRGLGMGKKSDDFYDLAGENGKSIKVDGKEYYITDTEFDSFSRGSDGKLIVRFDAPYKKSYADGGIMENGGTSSPNIKFMKWYDDWLTSVNKNVYVAISIPNEFSSPIKNGKGKIVILDVIEKKGDTDAKKYMNEILEKANEFGVSIYLQPIPRTHNLKSEEHKKKITKDYLIKYYEKFGFKNMDGGFMVREPKMAKGGVTFAEKVKSIKSNLLKRKKVAPAVQKDYGKTYTPKEAEESAKRIVGAMLKKRQMK